MAGHGEPEKPIISPEDFLRGQGVAVDRQRFCKALIAFMSVSEMATKFRGRITQEWVFSHTREPFHVRDDGTILVG